MPNILQLIAFLTFLIGGYLYIMWLINRSIQKIALKNAQQIPDSTKHLLKQSYEQTEVSRTERLKYVMRSAIIATIVYFVIFVLGVILLKNAVQAFDMKAYLIIMLVLFIPFFLYFVIDIFKVAPWNTVYRVKAIHCYTTTGKMAQEFVYYYDFIKEDFVVAALPDTTSLCNINTTKDGLFDILVVAKRHRLKLIDVVR